MTDEARKAKEYLKQVYDLKGDIEEVKLEIEQLKSETESITAVVCDLPKSLHSGNSMQEKLIRYIDKSDRLKEKLLELGVQKLEIFDKISEQINLLENPKYRKILSARYLRFQGWNEIFESLKKDFNLKDFRSIYKVHNKALEYFTKKCF